MADIINDKNLNPTVLQTVIERAESPKVRRLASAFPEQPVFDKNAVYNVVSDTAIKAGSIIGFDAETPIKNKPQVEKRMAELTKIANAYFYTEEELLSYNKPRSSEEQQQVIADVMKSIVNLDEGIEDTKELLRANYVYKGKFDYEDPKSKVKIEFDLDLPEGAVRETSAFDNESSNPLQDLVDQLEAYRDNNGMTAPDFMVMNTRTLSKLKRNPNVIIQVYGQDGAQKLLRNSDLFELFNELGLPTLEIDDNYTVIEGITEDRRIQHMPDDTVVMHAANLGQTLIGPAVESDYQPQKYVVNLKTKDAPNAKTIVGQVTIPVLKNIKGISILKVGEQADDSEDDGEDLP